MGNMKPEELGFSTARLGRIHDAMGRFIDEGRLAGTVALIYRNGQIVYQECQGKADLASGRPMHLDSLFRIYSMTKPITAAAVMMLLEESRLRLTDPVSAYLPEFTDMQVAELDEGGQVRLVPANTPITIRQLMTHTSGLGYGEPEIPLIAQRYAELVGPMWDGRGPDALKNFVTAVAQTPLYFHPGTSYHYGVSMEVAGRLVEVISGQPFGAFLQQRIFEPLKMADTGFTVPLAGMGRLCGLYQRENGKLIDVDPIANTSYQYLDRLQSGGGGLVSSAPDYLRFCRMILNGGELDEVRILGRKTVELMHTNAMVPGMYMDPDLQANGYGMGGYVLLNPGRAHANGSVGNWGWAGMANTSFWVDFQERMIAILMTQVLPYAVYPLEDLYKNLVYQAMV
jgi:CubicO group peptidase (beta-lactamase class C family)